MIKHYLLSICLMATTAMTAWASDQVRVYDNPEGGYVVVDENDMIVAFSDRGTQKDLSQGMHRFISNEGWHLNYTGQQMSMALINKMKQAEVKDSIGPLLGGIMFNQTHPYWNETPLYASHHCYTGCVATAMAEIMTKWKHPEVCNNGSVDYVTATLNLHVTYTFDNLAFDWDNILDTYDYAPFNDTQAEAVATLMAACGASVEMDYRADGSGAFSQLVPSALVSYFKYHIGLRFEARADFTPDSKFDEALQAEFLADRPVYASGDGDGGGHAYVIDGFLTYKNMENYPYYHFNWGWGGAGNEWCMLNRSGYKNSMEIIRYIMPEGMSDTKDVHATHPTDERIYDLMGRPVTITTPGHIYIRAGHKFIAR